MILAVTTVARLWCVWVQNKNSLLQDVLAGRPTERAALTGEVLRHAERLGIKCPRVAWLDAALHAYDGTVAGTYAEQGGVN